ncbi:uncharacterized protein DDB_G0283357 [Lingula anatina]|uniref:Uncharacterized protein DDB_G0283357 n=1 Tax=Lingula anatina TaxID=7574 RepID=A0A1S3HMT9_LINAN|nr:uncharacterized protein DDB_G0283357 [Lingula anatina]XP_013387332.1 uncharacterized protein DDB_G0283357 [Lingula anatina]|eukprot:XP_013387331.1 uncharacterized protein DDB_G0283357 [Lingula anatina]
MAGDVRELTFQNVLDNILKPAGVKVGGFPDEIFLDMSEEDREKWQCNICYLVANRCKQCQNKHLFCGTCIFAWSMTYGANSDKCPVCRVVQTDYADNKEIDKQLGDKKVKCHEATCSFSAPLKIFLLHSHGRQQFNNDDVDWASLRSQRPSPPRAVGLQFPSLGGLIVLPTLGPGPRQQVTDVRDQIRQGRELLQQMMTLLQLEMAMRSRALQRFSEAADPNVRMQRLDEVISMNEQMDELGSLFHVLLSTPVRPGTLTSRNTGAGGNSGPSPRGAAAVTARYGRFDALESDSDSDSDASSDSSGIVSRIRLQAETRRYDQTANGPGVTPAARNTGASLSSSHNGAGSNSGWGAEAATYYGNIASHEELRARRRSEIREELLGTSTPRASTNNPSTTSSTSRPTGERLTSLRRETEAPRALSQVRDAPVEIRPSLNNTASSQVSSTANAGISSNIRGSVSLSNSINHTATNRSNPSATSESQALSRTANATGQTEQRSSSSPRQIQPTSQSPRQLPSLSQSDSPRSDTNANTTSNRSIIPSGSREHQAAADEVISPRPPLPVRQRILRNSINESSNAGNASREGNSSNGVSNSVARQSTGAIRNTENSDSFAPNLSANLETSSAAVPGTSQESGNVATVTSNGASPRRATKYAPQKRFRRNTNSNDRINEGLAAARRRQAESLERNSNNATGTTSNRPTNGGQRNGENAGTRGRNPRIRDQADQNTRVADYHSNFNNSATNSRTETNHAHQRSHTPSRSSSNANGNSSRLPGTAGQLLRSRRRSEIAEEMMNLGRR